MKAGVPWQTTIGVDLEGLTLGVIGLGKLGTRTAAIAKAFGMKVIAWSQNLTPEKCKEAGVERVSRRTCCGRPISSPSTWFCLRARGLIGAAELALMKPSAYIINTSRGPIIEEAALIAALKDERIAGAGLDVFDTERCRPRTLRKMDNVVLTPHLGYVAAQNYRAYFDGVVEDIRAFLDGKPVRVLDWGGSLAGLDPEPWRGQRAWHAARRPPLGTAPARRDWAAARSGSGAGRSRDRPPSPPRHRRRRSRKGAACRQGRRSRPGRRR